jgi:hypothetical protein
LFARDASYYLRIATTGYETLDTWAFFPLFPWSARALGVVCGGPARAGLIVSVVASAAGAVALRSLARRSCDEPAARRAVALWLAAPTHFFFSAFYSEALFFALTTACLALASHDRLRPASWFGALAALTRSTGVWLLPALAVGAMHRRKRSSGALASRFEVAWLALIPVALASFFAFAFHRTGHFAAPLAAQTLWARKPTFPLLAIAQAAQDVRLSPLDLQRDVDCAATLGTFVLAARSLSRVGASSSVFLILSLFAPLSSGIVASMARYVAAVPTTFIVLAQWVASPWAFRCTLGASLVLQVLLALQFATGHGLI